MSDQENQTPTPPSNRAIFQMSDDAISMIREIVQLSLLTGTNIVDHLRAIQLEPTTDRHDRLTVTPEYVSAYNEMVMKLNEEAEAQRKLMQQTAAVDD